MTDIIIIATPAVAIGAILGYLIGVATGNQIGKASVKQPDTKTSIRYVRMDKDNVDRTNSDIGLLEIEDYTVTDYDAEDGIIEMEKEIKFTGTSKES